METKQISDKVLRQRKLLLFAPVLVIPFLTLFFWALGGGVAANATTVVPENKGFNAELPGVKLKDDATDKMSYYDRASADSARLAALSKNDPYYKDSAVGNGSTESNADAPYSLSGSSKNDYFSRGNSYGGTGQENERRVYAKLSQLNSALNAPQPSLAGERSPYAAGGSAASVNSREVDRLERLMQSMQEDKSSGDGEMSQMNEVMEKLLDLQNPERAQEKIRKASELNRGQVLPVTAVNSGNPVGYFGGDTSAPSKDSGVASISLANGFFSLSEPLSEGANNAIPAVVHETQTVVNGSTVKLRLTASVFINGMLIPKDNFLFGIASLQGERLSVSISGIRYQQALYPVNLNVYDLDGLAGVRIPGAISRDVAKQSADQAVQGFGLTSMSPSLGIQAAGAGIEAAKGLFSKKIKLVKVVLKAGYQVLLYDEKQRK